MITAIVKAFNEVPAITEAVVARTRVGLDEAAKVGAEVATAKAAGISEVEIVPTQETADGMRSGIRFTDFRWRFFDKGTLGKHRGKLKRARRDSWTVRRGTNPYVAQRRDVSGKGIEPREISNPARAAGRRVLLARIRGI